MSRSLSPLGRLLSLLIKCDLMAKPTPASRRSSLLRPLQKNVYPALTSVSCPSSANLVSLRAAMCMLYRSSSRATSAVRLSGLSALELSMRVRTFHVPKVSGVTEVFLVFRPRGWDPRLLRYAGQGVMKQAIFRAPFLAPSSCYGGEQSDPKEGCSDAQGAAGLHCYFSPVENDPIAWATCVQVRDYSFQCIRTCCFATRLSPQEFSCDVLTRA